MEFWCILVDWTSEQINKFNPLMMRKKILRPFQWPKFAKVFWAFPNLLSVSFNQIWNLRGSKDYTKELNHRPSQGKRDFFLCLNFWMILMKRYLLVTLYNHKNQLHPTASGELRMYLFQVDIFGLYMISYNQRCRSLRRQNTIMANTSRNHRNLMSQITFFSQWFLRAVFRACLVLIMLKIIT